MARRSRINRTAIPGYDSFRPSRDDRARDHRRVRHAANQMLRTVVDPEDLTLPRPRADHHHDPFPVESDPEPQRKRFDVGKTKFWKRRDSYREFKAAMDAAWPEVASD